MKIIMYMKLLKTTSKRNAYKTCRFGGLYCIYKVEPLLYTLTESYHCEPISSVCHVLNCLTQMMN